MSENIALDQIAVARWSGEDEPCPAIIREGQPVPLTRSQLQRLLVEAIAEIERLKLRLRAIVDKLPKTADGVPVVPGMTLWYSSPSGIRKTPLLQDWQDVFGYTDEDEYCGPVAFFSSKQAAEAAKGEKP